MKLNNVSVAGVAINAAQIGRLRMSAYCEMAFAGFAHMSADVATHDFWDSSAWSRR